MIKSVKSVKESPTSEQFVLKSKSETHADRGLQPTENAGCVTVAERGRSGTYAAEVNASRSEKMKGKANAKKHDLTKLRIALQTVGLVAISRNTALGAEIFRKRTRIHEDLGGRSNMTELQADLVESYLATDVLRESMLGYMLQQPSLVRKRSRSAYPIVQQYNQLVQTQVTLAQAIGLRKIKPEGEGLRRKLASHSKPAIAMFRPDDPPKAVVEPSHELQPFQFASEEPNLCISTMEAPPALESADPPVGDWKCLHCGRLQESAGEPALCRWCKARVHWRRV